MRPSAKRKSKFASGGRRASAPLVVACIATLPTMVSSVNQAQPAAIFLAGWIAVLGVMIWRSYEAFDVVVEAAENSTVQFVTAVGEESTKAVPVVFGIVLTVLLVVLTYVVQKFCITRKEKMKEYGESPEGNMPLSSTEVPAHGYPYMP